MERDDDFVRRREHLARLDEEQLEQRFWRLAEQIVEPLLELARTHTTPSIERSVLLRMGFSSMEANAIVAKVLDHDLIGKGAGHVVYVVASRTGLPVRDAGLKLSADELWDVALEAFRGA